MAARTILITGANTGIGAACARALAGPDVHLVLACRSEDKTAPVLAELRARGAKACFLSLDLADLTSFFEQRKQRVRVRLLAALRATPGAPEDAALA